MDMTTKRLHIGGMTCINCQTKITRTLAQTAGIQAVTVRYDTGLAEVTFDPARITQGEIAAIIEALGYQVLPETGTVDLSRLVCLLVIIVALFALLQQFGILNLLVPSQLADTNLGYGMLFLVGLITSVHCIAMCGGINLSQCIPRGDPAPERKLDTFLPSLLYNLGRVISYTVIGFLLGLVGLLLGGGSGAGIPTLLQGILKLLAGAIMVIMGVNLLGLFPWLRKLQLRLPPALAGKVGQRQAASRRPLVVGLCNGLMPCGPLQSVQIVALATGSPFAGALSMFLFSLGTVPLMLGLGSLVSALGRRFARGVMQVGGLLVVVLGLAMLSQGGSLSGLLLPNQLFVLVVALCILGVLASIPWSRSLYRALSLTAAVVLFLGGGLAFHQVTQTTSTPPAAAGEVALVDGVQVVYSTLTPGKYPNITVQAGIPVKWVIDAPEGSINGCNYKMLLSEYGITHEFTQGENVIEFTPETPGTVQYTCWMGMIHGNIFVVDGDETTASSGQTAAEAEVPVPAGYQIPSQDLAIAQPATDEEGQAIQTVTIDLTDEGFHQAVIVVAADLPVSWTINNTLSDAQEGTELLAPDYATKLTLGPGENLLALYPQESFAVSTGDAKFFAYVKVVDDLSQVDEEAIRQEVDGFQTLIYPDSVFESAGMTCCGGTP